MKRCTAHERESARRGVGPGCVQRRTGGEQQLCYNETLTKVNWHYLCWVLDMRKAEYIQLQYNDRTVDMRCSCPELRPEVPNVRGLLNLGLWVEAAAARCFFLIDSMLLSTQR